MNRISDHYRAGFINKCAEYGVDPYTIAKYAADTVANTNGKWPYDAAPAKTEPEKAKAEPPEQAKSYEERGFKTTGIDSSGNPLYPEPENFKAVESPALYPRSAATRDAALKGLSAPVTASGPYATAAGFMAGAPLPIISATRLLTDLDATGKDAGPFAVGKAKSIHRNPEYMGYEFLKNHLITPIGRLDPEGSNIVYQTGLPVDWSKMDQVTGAEQSLGGYPTPLPHGFTFRQRVAELMQRMHNGQK